jgi:hypothetical protein
MSFDEPVQPIHLQEETGARRPRWWTSFAVASISLVLCMMLGTVMSLVAMVVTLGETNAAALVDPATLAKVMQSRLGFCLIVIPPQLMLLGTSVVAAWLSPVHFRQRLSLVRGHWPMWTWLAVAAAAPLVGLISTVILG